MTSESKPIRLSTVARELNVGTATIIEFLAKKGYTVENNPNAKVPFECMDILDEEFKESKSLKEKAIKNTEKARENKEINISIEKHAKAVDVAPVIPVVEEPVIPAEPEIVVAAEEPEAEPEVVVEQPEVKAEPVKAIV